MGVAVERGDHLKAIQRLLEPARSKEGIDLERLALDGAGDRRIVEQRDALMRAQPRQRGFELERLLHGFAHELLDQRLAPRLEDAAAEAAGEAFDPGEADAADLHGVAIEQADG